MYVLALGSSCANFCSRSALFLFVLKKSPDSTQGPTPCFFEQHTIVISCYDESMEFLTVHELSRQFNLLSPTTIPTFALNRFKNKQGDRLTHHRCFLWFALTPNSKIRHSPPSSDGSLHKLKQRRSVACIVNVVSLTHKRPCILKHRPLVFQQAYW